MDRSRFIIAQVQGVSLTNFALPRFDPRHVDRNTKVCHASAATLRVAKARRALVMKPTDGLVAVPGKLWFVACRYSPGMPEMLGFSALSSGKRSWRITFSSDL